MTLTKYWAADGDLLCDKTEDCDIPTYLAADVEALLDDPQALAEYLIARKNEAKFGAVLKDVRETLRQIVTISLLADNSPKQNAARECGAEAKALLARLKEAQP